jgi:hypothetical protein
MKSNAFFRFNSLFFMPLSLMIYAIFQQPVFNINSNYVVPHPTAINAPWFLKNLTQRFRYGVLFNRCRVAIF